MNTIKQVKRQKSWKSVLKYIPENLYISWKFYRLHHTLNAKDCLVCEAFSFMKWDS